MALKPLLAFLFCSSCSQRTFTAGKINGVEMSLLLKPAAVISLGPVKSCVLHPWHILKDAVNSISMHPRNTPYYFPQCCYIVNRVCAGILETVMSHDLTYSECIFHVTEREWNLFWMPLSYCQQCVGVSDTCPLSFWLFAALCAVITWQWQQGGGPRGPPSKTLYF